MCEEISHLKRDTSLVDKVYTGLMGGNYWAILGPRFSGKSTFLRQVEDRLKEEPGIKPIYIYLGDYSKLPRLEYYTKLYGDIIRGLGIEQERMPEINIRRILESILPRAGGIFVLLLSGIETLNKELSRELLLSFKRCHDNQEDLRAIVSGSISLLRLSHGKNSPFNMAETLSLVELSEEEAIQFIEGIASKKKIILSEEGRVYLIQQTNGHPYLIAKLLEEAKEETINKREIDEAIGSFIEKGAGKPCLKEIIRDLERSVETFKVFIEIRDGKFPKAGLERIEEPETSGLFKRREDMVYEVSNEVFKRFIDTYFDYQNLGDIFLLHGDWESAKSYYGKAKNVTRKDVIEAFGRVMIKEKELSRVESILLEGAEYLFDFKKARLVKVVGEGKYALCGDIVYAENLEDISRYQELIERAVSNQRISFDGEVMSIPLFIYEKEQKWLLLIEESPIIDDELIDAFRMVAGLALENASYLEKLRELKEKEAELKELETAMRVAVGALEARDPYTKGHSDKVSKFAGLIVEELDKGFILKETGMANDEFKQKVKLAGLLHDVGKIGIRENVLTKEGSLIDEEWWEIQTHPYFGSEIVSNGSLGDISRLILHHHEKTDGKGYPHGLKGKKIPLGSRILALADSFDAMTSNRVYRQGMPPEMALAELEMLSSRGSYDLDVWKAFISAIKKNPQEFPEFSVKSDNIDSLIKEVYDPNFILQKRYFDERLKEYLKEIKRRSEKTVSLLIFSVDAVDVEETSVLKEIKWNLKSALFGNYDDKRYVILLPDKRYKDTYIKAQQIQKAINIYVNNQQTKEVIQNPVKNRSARLNIGIYEPLLEDKDKGMEIDDIYKKLDEAHRNAVEKRSIVIIR